MQIKAAKVNIDEYPVYTFHLSLHYANLRQNRVFNFVLLNFNVPISSEKILQNMLNT